MRRPTDKEEADAQLLYDSLAERSKRDFAEYDGERPSPAIPGELAFLVDDLLELAEGELGCNRDETLAEVIDLGIVAWFRLLEPPECERLGVPYLGQSATPLEESRAAEELQATEELRAALERSESQLAAERRRTTELELEIESLAQASDPDPSKVQRRLGPLGQSAPGYVPLSAHTLHQPKKRPRKK